MKKQKSNNRKIVPLIIMALFLLGASKTFASGVALDAVFDKSSYTAGDEVEVNLQFSNAAGILTNSFGIEVDYDAAYYKLLNDCADMDIINTYIPYNVKVNSKGSEGINTLYLTYMNMFDYTQLQDGKSAATIRLKVNSDVSSGNATLIIRKVSLLEDLKMFSVNDDLPKAFTVEIKSLTVEPVLRPGNNPGTIKIVDEKENGELGDGSGLKPERNNRFLVKVSSKEIVAPMKGAQAPAGENVIDPYTPGEEISGADGDNTRYLGFYEVNESSQVVRFKLLTLSVDDKGSEKINYQTISVTKPNQAVLTFNSPIINNFDTIEELKASIEFASEEDLFNPLRPEDTLEMKDNMLIISFAERLAGEENQIRVMTGALRDEDGYLLEGFTTEKFSALLLDECFIATAAFGTQFSPAVMILRQFRDKHLLNTSLGKAFVSFYYRISPPLAEFIAGSEAFKRAVRMKLFPAIVIAYVIMNP